MTKRIQIRKVPDALYRTLKDRAAKFGISFSDYMLSEIHEIAERPTLADFRERLHERTSVSVDIDGAGIVREGREAREVVVRAPRRRRKS